MVKKIGAAGEIQRFFVPDKPLLVDGPGSFPRALRHLFGRQPAFVPIRLGIQRPSRSARQWQDLGENERLHQANDGNDGQHGGPGTQRLAFGEAAEAADDPEAAVIHP